MIDFEGDNIITNGFGVLAGEVIGNHISQIGGPKYGVYLSGTTEWVQVDRNTFNTPPAGGGMIKIASGAAQNVIGYNIAETSGTAFSLSDSGTNTQYKGTYQMGGGASPNSSLSAQPQVSAVLYELKSTGNAANYNSGSAATLLAVPATGLYRVTVYTVLTAIDRVSSTVPSNTIGWTDPTNSDAMTQVATATNSRNSLNTHVTGSVLIYAKTGTNITLTSAGYASNTPGAMTYTLCVVLEGL
jgi:hypothetical protein